MHSFFDNKSCVYAPFLDVPKALNSANPKSLLRKLYHAGFRSFFFVVVIGHLISSHSQIVSNCVRTTKVSFNSRIPQDSVLSLLLFNIYVNNLSKVVSCNLLDADDTLLFSSHKNIEFCCAVLAGT